MGQELTIGRGYSNLLRLEGDEISRVHAIIYRRNEDFILRDLDSKNGVFLNGSKVSHAPLGPGDKLQVGKYRMVFNPPQTFDLDAFVRGAGKFEEQLSDDSNFRVTTTKGSSSGKLEMVTNELEVSRRFTVAPFTDSSDTMVRAARQEPDGEVHIFTAGEFSRLISEEARGRVAEVAADCQDNFFRSLLENRTEAPNFNYSVLQAIAQAVGAERGAIVMRKPNGELYPGAIYATQPDVAVNRVVLKSVFSEQKTILCPRTDECGLFRENDTVKRDRITSLIGLPLGQYEPEGLLYLDRTVDAEPFTYAHLVAVGRMARLLEIYLLENSNRTGVNPQI